MTRAAMTGSVQHLAIDGSTVTITSSADLGAIATTAGRFTVDGIVREITTQPAGLFDALVAAEGVAPTEEYQYRGGTLRIGRAVHADPVSGTTRTDTTAVWESAGVSLALTSSDLTTTAQLALLDRFDLQPGPTGLAVLPGSGVGWYDAPQLVKELPGVGLLEITPLSNDTAGALPSWPGTPAQGGELYQDQLAPGAPYVVLVTETARVNVLPDTGAIDAAADAAALLEVEWVRP